ncbi:MAG TPA: O-antigen ligase family protein [Desulfobulbus sp.]|nr:O-antigen ligase family protein [Desulfobulbus sp.]
MNSTAVDTFRWQDLPWGLILFIFGVFFFATPLDFFWPVKVLESFNITDAADAAVSMARGNMGRQIALGILAVFSIWSLAWNRNRFRINGLLGWLIMFFLAWAIFSICWSVNPVFTIKRVATLCILSLGALAVADRLSLRELMAFGVVILFVTMWVGFFAEVHAGTFAPRSEEWRFAGLMHTVAMGWNCGLLILLAAALARDRGRGDVLGLVLVIAMALFFLIITKSRMAVFSAFLGVGLYWTLVSPGTRRVTLVLLLLIGSSLLFLALQDRFLPFMADVATLGRGEAAKESVGTLTGRLPLWSEALRYVLDRPILGYGYNTFINPGSIINISKVVGWIPSSVHSAYLDALTGTGLVGIITLLAILALAFKRALELSRFNPAYAFAAGLIVWLCYNFFLEAHLLTRPFFMTFYAMIVFVKLAFLPAEAPGS